MYVTDVTDIYMSKNGRYLIDAVFDGESHGGLRVVLHFAVFNFMPQLSCLS